MKTKILTIGFILMGFSSIQAQIAFEKNNIDGSGLIDFKEGTTKGIILPYVTDANTMTDTSAGTLVFDMATSRIKLYDGNEWLDMSGKNGLSPIINNTQENPTDKGVIIGDPSSTAKGVLVLESENKALILPKVIDPVNNVKSPVAGMMCYDPDAQLICLYNGLEWTFWGDID